MGLAEKRAVQKLKEGDFNKFVETARKICGYDLAVDLDWDSIEKDADCVSSLENTKPQDYFFARTEEALHLICADEMGKSAAKEKLKKICFVNKEAPLEFTNGVLTINSRINGSGVWGADSIKECLEAGL